MDVTSDDESKYPRYEYHYGSEGAVVAGAKPPTPKTSFERVTGGILFRYPNQVTFGGDTSQVGWQYALQRYVTAGPNPGWYVVHRDAFSLTSRTVATSTR